MTVTFDDWRIEPYRTNGARCWQVFHGKSGKAMRYYDDLADALLFCAQYDLRNKVEGTCDVAGALAEYGRIAESIREAAGAICGEVVA